MVEDHQIQLLLQEFPLFLEAAHQYKADHKLPLLVVPNARTGMLQLLFKDGIDIPQLTNLMRFLMLSTSLQSKTLIQLLTEL